MKTIVISISVLIALAISAACSDSSKTNLSNTSTAGNTSQTNSQIKSSTLAINEDTSHGQELYVAQCANCHKESGEGGVVVVDGRKMKADNLTDDRRKKLTDEKIIKTMVDGIPDEGMPSYKDKLSEAEMREVVRYIRVELQKMPASPPYANSASPQQ